MKKNEKTVYILEHILRTEEQGSRNDIYGVFDNEFVALGHMYSHFYSTVNRNEASDINYRKNYEPQLSTNSMTMRHKENYLTDYEMFRVNAQTVMKS